MIVRGVAIIVPAQIFKLAISLLLQILIARTLLPEGRGLYGICLAISTALLIFTYFGNEFGIRHLLVKKRITSAQALRYLLITATLSWIIAGGIAFATMQSQIRLPEGVATPLLLLACTLSFSQLVTTQINVFMTLRGQFGAAAILAVSEELIKLALMAYLLFHFPSVEMALLASIIGCCLITAVSVIYGGLFKRDFETLQFGDLRTIYSYGARSVWLNLSNLSNAHIGTLVLAGLMSNAQVGIYNLAFGLVARLQVIPDALNRVLVPASMTHETDDQRYRMIQISVAGLTLFCLCAAPFLAVFNRPIFELMFGSEFSAAGPVAFFLFVGFSCKIIGKPLEAHFNEISGNPKALGIVQILSMILMTGLTYVGAERFGLLGATIGSSAALILSSTALIALYSRSTGRSVLSLLNFRPLVSRLRELRER